MGNNQEDFIQGIVEQFNEHDAIYTAYFFDHQPSGAVSTGFHHALMTRIREKYETEKWNLPPYLSDYGLFCKKFEEDRDRYNATKTMGRSASVDSTTLTHSTDSISPNPPDSSLPAIDPVHAVRPTGDTNSVAVTTPVPAHLEESTIPDVSSSDTPTKSWTSSDFIKGLAVSAVVVALTYAGYAVYQHPEYVSDFAQLAQTASSSAVQSLSSATSLAGGHITTALSDLSGGVANVQEGVSSVATSTIGALPGAADALSVRVNGLVQNIPIQSIYQVLQTHWANIFKSSGGLDSDGVKDVQAILSSMQGITSSNPAFAKNIGDFTSQFVQVNSTALGDLIKSQPSEVEFISSIQTMASSFFEDSYNQFELPSVGSAVIVSGVSMLLASVWWRSQEDPVEKNIRDASPPAGGGSTQPDGSVPTNPMLDPKAAEFLKQIQNSAPSKSKGTVADPANPQTIFNLPNVALGTSVLALSALALTPQGQALSSGLIHSPIPTQLATSAKELLSSGWQMVSGLFAPEMGKYLVQFSDVVVPYVAPDSVWQKIGSIAPGLAAVLGLGAVGYGYVASKTPLPPPGDKPSVADGSDVNQVVFVGEDESEIVRKKMDDLMQSLDLDADSFRYCVGGVDQDRNEQAYAVTCSRHESGNYFIPDDGAKEVLDAAKRDGFSAQQVQVSWKNAEGELDKDTQLPASYYAALTGLLEALESMPGKKIRIDGCEDMHFFRGICDAVCIHAKKGESSLDLMNRYVSNFSELNSQFKHEPKRTDQWRRLAKINTYQASAQTQPRDLGSDNSSDLNLDTKGKEPESNL